MTVRNGRDFLNIPGPTTVPDEVLNAMHRQPIDIYGGPLLDVTERCREGLKKIFRTTGRPYIYVANGHGAWEAALSNTLSRGDKVLVLASGLFAPSWGEMGKMLGLDVEIMPGSWRQAVDPDAVQDRLNADTTSEIKAILVVQVDTASGVVNDVPAIRKAIDSANHNALFMVDTIASLGTMPFEMDDWRVDLAVAGSQKGLMSPPGLSFIAAGERALAAHRTAGSRTAYWDWTFREGEVHYQKYCGTPPEHLLFALDKAFELLFEEGLEAVFERHRLLAEAVRRAVTVWSEGGVFDFNVDEPEARANSVTAILMKDGQDPASLLKFCEEKCGVVLGIGIGALNGKAFRIAHMGHINAPMILGVLSVIEMALVALKIPHGSGGTGAAVEWLGKELSV